MVSPRRKIRRIDYSIKEVVVIKESGVSKLLGYRHTAYIFRLDLKSDYVYKFASLLTFDCSDAGKRLSFDGFEQSTATGRDVRHLVGHAEFIDAGYRVATTDERESTISSCLSNSIGNGT